MVDKFQLLEKKYWLQSRAVESKPSFPLPNVTFPLPQMADVSASIRSQIDSLWNIPNKTHNILRACADAGASKPKDEHEVKAVEGHKFCQKLLNIVDYLKANRDTVSLSDIRKGLDAVVALIKENIQHTEAEKQFPGVSALIFHLMPSSKKYDRKIRDQEYAKARKGLSRMASIALTILNEMNRLGGKSEEVGRFEPQGAKLSNEEIMSFIRQHGDTYGIPDLATWSLAVDTDPALELPLTKLVHALSRGQVPSGAEKIKPIIQNIISRRQELTQTNAPIFEEEGEAWDHKMASKYNELTLERYTK